VEIRRVFDGSVTEEEHLQYHAGFNGFLHTLLRADESDVLRIVSVTGGRPMDYFRPQHFWHLGPWVQGLRCLLSLWQELQGREVFEVRKLPGAPKDAVLHQVPH